MNIVESTEESSCKGREDGDASTGSERPLKKARFAWQVKGKYHLKNETDKSNKNPTLITTTSNSGEPSHSTSSTLGSEVEDYPMKQDYKFESVISPNNSLLTPNTSVLKNQQQYPRYISTSEKTSNNMLRNKSCSNVKTVSMTDIAEDQCIAQWQSRQMMKGCVDNALNQVLESWSNGSLSTEHDNSRYFAFDFAEFINHFPGDNSVENEGILMAISAHGLQNTINDNTNTSNIDNCSTTNTPVYAMDTPSTSPIMSDEDTQQLHTLQSDEEKLANDLQPWQHDNQNGDNATPFAFFSEPSQSQYSFFEDNHQNSDHDSDGVTDYFDFMNAAVLYAIKSEGLTVSGTEYG